MTSIHASRVNIGRLAIDRVSFTGALDAIASMVLRGDGGMVVTPNVDHVVMAEDDPRFEQAYAAADLSLADGMPVVWASYLLRKPLPAKVSGSDLAPALMKVAAAKGFRVYLLGGAPGVADLAAKNLRRLHPSIEIVGTASPRIDLSEPMDRRRDVVERIQEAAPDLVLVALGAPKQEIWMHEAKAALRPAVLIGVGASIDFLAGTARRAPRWMSASGLEWLHRLAREPRRLWRRYLVRGPRFLGIVLGDLRAARIRDLEVRS